MTGILAKSGILSISRAAKNNLHPSTGGLSSYDFPGTPADYNPQNRKEVNDRRRKNLL
jgi:hypothetical protein